MRPIVSCQRGFTLIELAIVLAILAVLAGAAIPYAASQVRTQAAETVAREMLAVADAAKSYYVANAAWPASLGALQSAGSLPSGWSAQNPFGQAYTITSATTLTVQTTVPTDVAPAVARLAPLGSQTPVPGGTRVAGTWPRPGQSSDLASVQGLPRNAVVFYNGTDCTAAGLSEVTAARGRYLVGLQPGGTLGGTGGTALSNLENRPVGRHTHAVSDPGHSHQYTSPSAAALSRSGPNTYGWAVTAQTSPATTGISMAPAGTVDGTPAPYLQLVVCQKTG